MYVLGAACMFGVMWEVMGCVEGAVGWGVCVCICVCIVGDTTKGVS